MPKRGEALSKCMANVDGTRTGHAAKFPMKTFLATLMEQDAPRRREFLLYFGIAWSSRMIAWDGKGKHGPWPVVARSPKAATMGLDNRPAQREPDSHPFLFRSEEGLEKATSGFSIEPDTGILDTYVDLAAIHLRAHREPPRSVVYPSHGIGGIPHKIEDHLLELD